MMMFAEIAVNTYQDPTKKLFTYEVPKNLEDRVKPGDLVAVPFGKRMVNGFIYQLTSKKPKLKIKPIVKVKKKGVLTSKQVKLAQWMGAYYAAPPLDCLKCQIPGRGERYTEGKGKEIKTLLLVPYATKVKIKALELTSSERRTTLIGSRSAIFASPPNLKKIIIEEPENWAYKDERSPYYHAKDVAQKRAELEGLRLELRYTIPRVEDVAQEKLHSPKLKAKIRVVDLKKERDAGNFSPLSSELAEELRRAKRALVYVISSEARKEVERAIRAESLDFNRIEIAGAEIFAVVGKAYDVAALIDTDTLLNLPDFRSHEKLILAVAKLSQLAKGRIFVQTANISYPLFDALKAGNLKNFYQQELATRKPLLYPPFGVLAKLEFSAKKTTKVSFEAEKFHKTLTGRLRKAKGVRISSPYPPYIRSRGKAQLNIAIKARTHRELEKALTFVPPTWKVIVDPKSLL